VLYHYVRLKVFDAKGKEKAGTIDLPYSESGGILDVAGRTIKPDGTILELDRKTVYKRDLIRGGFRTEKVVSFAMPGVEDGVILEYRWKQAQNDNRFRYLRLNFTRDLPVHKVTYFVRPLSSDLVASEQMYLLPFNCKPTPLERDRDGWNETSVMNVPAARDEPYAPTEPNILPWALLYYREGKIDPQKYWNDQAKKTYSDFKSQLKLESEQKLAATQTIARATTDDEKMMALMSYVRKQLRNFFDSDVTEAERNDFLKKLPDNRARNAAEILKSGIALSDEMNVALGALATHVGLEVRPVMVANRNEVIVDPKTLPERYFIDDVDIGLKSGDSWKLFNVSRKHLHPGMIPAQQEGMVAIVSDPKSAIFMNAPVSPPEASAENRLATLKLTEEGLLTGGVQEAYSGFRGEEYRSRFARQSPAQREQWMQDRIARMFPGAEVTQLTIENVDDAMKPLQIAYHLDARLFAQVTGKRILFNANPFRRSQAAPFAASDRWYPVEFPYAWKEMDTIQIELPSGFELESPDNPGSMDFGEPGSYKLTMTVKGGQTTELAVVREFTFGAKGLTSFPVRTYPSLKKVFDEVQLRDTHSLSLRGN
jgi:hypothetical protein